MKPSTSFYLLLVGTTVAYFAGSKYLFDKVYDTSQVVIDELFHLPQGLAYCNRNFTYWDPKITTLPGLYLVSSTFLGSYFKCDTYNLRFVNLVASCANFLLFASILKFIYGRTTDSQLKIVLQAFNLAILPPLYFFSHLYYTDTLSLTFLLAFSRLCFENKHKMAILVLGLLSVIMRQTNVVWVAMVFGHKFLDIFIRSSRVFGNKKLSNMTLSRTSKVAQDVDSSKLRRYYGIGDVFLALQYHITTCFKTVFKFITVNDWAILITHFLVLVSFVTFVFVNGSIVVGDKKAHTATLHIPQMFYFLIFYGVFALPYLLAKVPSTLKLMLRNKTNFILFSMLFTAIVHYNTVVHPYLLADNRHYTFYIWNRWFGKYDFAIYASVPAYVFLLFSLYDNLREQNCVAFLLPYTICAFAVLALQSMIEVRYFLIPYVILRLRFVRPSYKMVLLESVWYILLNTVTLYLFFERKIFWKNFEYAQRIIW